MPLWPKTCSALARAPGDVCGMVKARRVFHCLLSCCGEEEGASAFVFEFRRTRKRVVFPFFSSMPETRMSSPYNSAASGEQIAALLPLLSCATSSAARDVDVVSCRSRPGSAVERNGVH